MSPRERGARPPPNRAFAYALPDLGDNTLLRITDPSLDEVMASPLVHLVMRRDGLTPDDVWRVIRTAQHRMNQGVAGRAEARCG